jgi:hypothetical protein
MSRCPDAGGTADRSRSVPARASIFISATSAILPRSCRRPSQRRAMSGSITSGLLPMSAARSSTRAVPSNKSRARHSTALAKRWAKRSRLITVESSTRISIACRRCGSTRCRRSRCISSVLWRKSLCDKRAEIAGQIVQAETPARQLRADLAHVEATIRILRPGTELPKIVPKQVEFRPRYFKRGQLTRLIRDHLREQGFFAVK